MVNRPAGVLVISVRADLDPDTTRAEAYRHIGLGDGDDPDNHGGEHRAAAVELIDGIHTLATHPEASTRCPIRDGVDSEGHPTHLHMASFGGNSDEQTAWLRHTETVHATWPRLLDTLGACIGGTVFDGADAKEHRAIHVPATRVPKMLRLKAGWDYDADGNQEWLAFDEAWERLTAHDRTRPEERRMDARLRRRIRHQMRRYYSGRPTTRPNETSTP